MKEFFIKLLAFIPFVLVFMNMYWYSENRFIKAFAYNAIFLCIPSIMIIVFIFSYYK